MWNLNTYESSGSGQRKSKLTSKNVFGSSREGNNANDKNVLPKTYNLPTKSILKYPKLSSNSCKTKFVRFANTPSDDQSPDLIPTGFHHDTLLQIQKPDKDISLGYESQRNTSLASIPNISCPPSSTLTVDPPTSKHHVSETSSNQQMHEKMRGNLVKSMSNAKEELDVQEDVLSENPLNTEASQPGCKDFIDRASTAKDRKMEVNYSEGTPNEVLAANNQRIKSYVGENLSLLRNKDSQRLQLAAKSVSIILKKNNASDVFIKEAADSEFATSPNQISLDDSKCICKLGTSDKNVALHHASQEKLETENEWKLSKPRAVDDSEKVEVGKMLNHVTRILRRRCLGRAFQSWHTFKNDKIWKMQLKLRDEQIMLHALQIRKLNHRPIVYMDRYRLRVLFLLWLSKMRTSKFQLMKAGKINHKHMRTNLKEKFIAWRDALREGKMERTGKDRADTVYAWHLVQVAFQAWMQFYQKKKHHRKLILGYDQDRKKTLLLLSMGCWKYLARLTLTGKAIENKHARRTLSAALRHWTIHLVRSRYNDSKASELIGKRGKCRCYQSFYIWRAYVDGRHFRKEEATLKRLRAKAEQLETENQRLTRVVDAVDLEKVVSSEFYEAIKALQQERDALFGLIDNISSSTHTCPESTKCNLESAQVNLPKNRIDQHRKNLVSREKEFERKSEKLNRIGGGQNPKSTLIESKSFPDGKGSQTFDASHRNKMLVRTGSSFNSLVRALKQDLITSGALKRNPNIAYEISKLSLNRIDALADGEIRIEGISAPASFPGYGSSRQESEMKSVARSSMVTSHTTNSAKLKGNHANSFCIGGGSLRISAKRPLEQ